MTLPPLLYQPLLLQELEGVDDCNEADDRHLMGPLHVDLDQQYYLVALAPPATNDIATSLRKKKKKKTTMMAMTIQTLTLAMLVLLAVATRCFP
jgi:hypothetical protein